jgi:hypothetical protein
MRDRPAVQPSSNEDFFFPVSRGVLEGGANASQTWSRSYLLQNSWQEFSADKKSLIHVYAGAVKAKPCTGAIVVERTPYPHELANPPAKIRVLRFEGIGPVTVIDSVGTTVRLRSAEGDHAVLEAEIVSVRWRAPARRKDLTQAQCFEL